MPKLRLFFIILITLIVASGGFFIFLIQKNQPAQAGSGENVRGWAWSENIGWISFNSLDCDNNPEDGLSDGVPPGCPSLGTPISSYGVNVNLTTGWFSGYAWSENIGWIRFDPVSDFSTGLYPENPQQPAQLNILTNQVIGWARACAGLDDDGDGIPNNCQGPTRTDGWDGWIKFNHGQPNEVSFDASSGHFHGYAWGSDVVDWISFNCANPSEDCSSSDYKVYKNMPPVAVITYTDSSPSSPSTFKGDTVNLDGSGSYDPDGPAVGGITDYSWTVIKPSSASLSFSSIVNPSFLADEVGKYTVNLIVTDNETDTGTMSVSIDVQPFCGDGVVDIGEICEPGLGACPKPGQCFAPSSPPSSYDCTCKTSSWGWWEQKP
jgi:hypothetical protein